MWTVNDITACRQEANLGRLAFCKFDKPYPILLSKNQETNPIFIISNWKSHPTFARFGIPWVFSVKSLMVYTVYKYKEGKQVYNYTKHTCCIVSIIFLQYLGGRLHWRNMSIFTQYQRMSWRKTTSFEAYGKWKKALLTFKSMSDISENISITF